MAVVTGANQLIEQQLVSQLTKIEAILKGDCIAYVGPIAFGADNKIRDAVEALRQQRGRKRKLILILETNGGYAEVARRISDAVRHKYREVAYVIPSHAMSAGTILAMSGDEIWMDYYSVLGPIDPQVPSQDGRSLVPALGYLVRYEELLAKASAGKANAAELQILLSFDQGELYSYRQARDLSVSLLREWLVKYKFKNWRVTQKRRRKVTGRMKRQRAVEIANKLNDIKRWNSHGIGINMVLLKKELNLRIDDFGIRPALNDAVREYHRLLADYMGKMGHESVIHCRLDFEPLRWR
jgi:serine dehydrogenase proteinase